ncbi:MAG: hypothetical protein PHR71_11680, partial [Polaromonas sp.]|nr:hypothetical protein [Polaromonas sp.]
TGSESPALASAALPHSPFTKLVQAPGGQDSSTDEPGLYRDKKMGGHFSARLSEATLRQVLRHFATDLTRAECGCEVTTTGYQRH